MSAVRFAPSAWAGARRVALILLASAAIYLGLLAVLGPPSPDRVPKEGPRQPYGPTVPLGLVQFLGQGAMLAAGVYAARRWLKVRL